MGSPIYDRKLRETRIRLALVGILCLVFIVGYAYVFTDGRLSSLSSHDRTNEAQARRLAAYYGLRSESLVCRFGYDKVGAVDYYAERLRHPIPVASYWNRRLVLQPGTHSSPDGQTTVTALFSLSGSLVGCDTNAEVVPDRMRSTASNVSAAARFLDEFAPALKQRYARGRPTQSGQYVCWPSRTDPQGLVTAIQCRVNNGKVTQLRVCTTTPRLVEEALARSRSMGAVAGLVGQIVRRKFLVLAGILIGILAVHRKIASRRAFAMLVLLGVLWTAGGFFKTDLPLSLDTMASALYMGLISRLLWMLGAARVRGLTDAKASTDAPLNERILMGLLGGSACLVFALIFYGILTKTGLAWISLQPPFGSETGAPLLERWHTLWHTGWEEVTYRAFMIPLVFLATKNRAAAICLPAVLWGVSHISGASYPFFVRIIEVASVGIIYGCLYLRYGLVTVLVAHWFEDGLLLFATSTENMSIGIGVFAVGCIVFAVVLPSVHGALRRKDRCPSCL